MAAFLQSNRTLHSIQAKAGEITYLFFNLLLLLLVVFGSGLPVALVQK